MSAKFTTKYSQFRRMTQHRISPNRTANFMFCAYFSFFLALVNEIVEARTLVPNAIITTVAVGFDIGTKNNERPKMQEAHHLMTGNKIKIRQKP